MGQQAPQAAAAGNIEHGQRSNGKAEVSATQTADTTLPEARQAAEATELPEAWQAASQEDISSPKPVPEQKEDGQQAPQAAAAGNLEHGCRSTDSRAEVPAAHMEAEPTSDNEAAVHTAQKTAPEAQQAASQGHIPLPKPLPEQKAMGQQAPQAAAAGNIYRTWTAQQRPHCQKHGKQHHKRTSLRQNLCLSKRKLFNKHHRRLQLGT